MAQLALPLFDDALPPEPPMGVPAQVDARDGPGTSFYVAGWKVWRVDNWPFGGEGPNRQMYGWQANRIGTDDGCWIVGAHCPRALRELLESWAKAACLPMDLYAKGWQRSTQPGFDHWLYWPAGCISCCLDTLDANIACARKQRPWSELQAWAAVARAAVKPTKRKRVA